MEEVLRNQEVDATSPTARRQPRTRILHVTFNMGFGGTEQVIRQLVKNLDPNRFVCEIACIDGEIGAIGKEMEADNGIKIHSRQRGSGLDWKIILWLRKLIRNDHFDIVHCHQYSPYTYGWFAHWGTGAKLIFTEHGRFHPDRYRKKARFINPLIARTTKSLVAISSATRDALVEYEYLPRHKIDVIYNGIAPLKVSVVRRETLSKELGLKTDEIVLGTVARLDAVKNQALILRATRALLDKGLKIRLLLVGDGAERENLEALAKKLKLGPAVIFAGFQTEPADYLSLMDVFLLPSFTEGTSMTLLEAMSLGIPTVATRVGGTPEIVMDGYTGILVESGDLKGFITALQTLIDMPKKKREIAQQAKSRFNKCFSVQKMVEQYACLYETNRNT
ncbi:glycosyltransferase [Marinobacter sp. F4216]|uniref:glycosyltransferase n=1 Tax=Marinobacter sp. F4216 TaxID=2874281 RepID=UPI001CBDD41B|nr:glycosyltransferase [Marinobacter sp. F4216]MBZ2167690.1 glycosyltransferase [Marinobacter sp. F4216]